MSADLDGSNMVPACFRNHLLSGLAYRETLARSRFEYGSSSTFAIFPY
jgi:hypothetical protein